MCSRWRPPPPTIRPPKSSSSTPPRRPRGRGPGTDRAAACCHANARHPPSRDGSGAALAARSQGLKVALIQNRAVRSCVTPVSTVGAVEVTTLEGLGTVDRPHPIQKAFIDEQAAQCGFCLSGVILSAKALLDRQPNATDTELRQALGGVLCRCFTHTRMFKAIRRYQQGLKA